MSFIEGQLILSGFVTFQVLWGGLINNYHQLGYITSNGIFILKIVFKVLIFSVQIKLRKLLLFAVIYFLFSGFIRNTENRSESE